MWFGSAAKFKGVLPWPVCNLTSTFHENLVNSFFFSVILLTNKQTKPKTKPPLAEVTNIETLSIF